jgi:arylsulfatase A-like enzyme
MIVRMPGVVAQGKRCGELINHVDLFPTLAGLTGSAAGLPKNQSGRNFAGTVAGKEPGREMTFSVHGVRAWNKPSQEVMARSKRWKFMWYPSAGEGEQYVLYDMENDPDEFTNVAGRAANKSVVAEHRQAVTQFLAGLRKPEYEPKAMEKGRKHVPE